MLRIVCVVVSGEYQGRAHLCKETASALISASYTTGVEVNITTVDPDDAQAYGHYLASEWTACRVSGDSLAIVEPDIVIDASVVNDFLHCDCGYGGRPYSWGPEVGIALGCTRFRASFIERYPAAMDKAVAKGVAWNQFDVVFQRHILVREHGEQPHICGATVPHLNPLKALRPEADPTPIASLPAW